MKSRPHLGLGLKAAISQAGPQRFEHRSSFLSFSALPLGAASEPKTRASYEWALETALSSSIPVFQWDVKSQFFFNDTWVCYHNPVNYFKMSPASVLLAGNGERLCLAIRPTVPLLETISGGKC